MKTSLHCFQSSINRLRTLLLWLGLLAGFCLQAQLPTIDTPPVDTSSCQGQPVSLTVAATDATWYLWYQGATLVDSGPAESTFTIPAMEPANAGAYTVVVTNLSGAVTSAPVQLTLTDIIVTGPGTVASCPGADVTLTVTVNDLSLATFVQWNDPGGNAVQIAFQPPILPSDLTLTVAGAQASGTYTVEVDGMACIVYTPIALTVASPPPMAVVTPASQTVCIGSPATFTVTNAADGYYWYFIDTNTLATNLLAFQTSPTFTLPSLQPEGIGYYAVALTNCGGATMSLPAWLGSNMPPNLVIEGHWRMGEAGTNGLNRRPIDSTLNYRDFNRDSSGANGTLARIITNFTGYSLPPIPSSSAYYVLSNAGFMSSAYVAPSNNLGIECWAQSWNFSSTNTTGSGLLVFGTSTNNSTGMAIRFDGISGFYAAYPGIAKFTNYYRPAASNEWVHLALVIDNGVCTFYINGQPNFLTNSCPAAANGLMIGMNNGGGGAAFFNGAVDECRVFTFAPGTFNPQELLYNPTPPPLCLFPNWLTTMTETNWAVTGVATASSQYQVTNGSPMRAIDGNTDGVWADNSVFHSGGTPDLTPWWQVDLKSVKPIGRVKIYWRTDCCGERNTNFVFTIYDGSSNVVFVQTNRSFTITTNAMAFDFPAGTMSGRYVKIQTFNAAGLMHLAEVKVLAPFVDASVLVTQQPPPMTDTVQDSTPVTVGPVGGVTLPITAQAQLNIQWQRNGVNIPFANSPTYVVPQAYNGDQYQAVLSLSGVSATTSPQVVSGIPTAPIIRFQPADNVNVILAANNSATFSVTALGSDPLAYQWYSNGVAVAGANAASYTIDGLNALSGGDFYVVVSNALGTATSQVAVLSTSPNVAVGFDFNTVGQLTNNFGMRNGADTNVATWFEKMTNGVGNVPGALDGWNTNNGNYNTVTYLNDAFPYPTNDGATLNVAIMFKGKRSGMAAPGSQVQVGFMDAGTNFPTIGTNNFFQGGGAANWLNLRTYIPANYTNLALQGGVYMTYNALVGPTGAGTASYAYYSSNTPTIQIYTNIAYTNKIYNNYLYTNLVYSNVVYTNMVSGNKVITTNLVAAGSTNTLGTSNFFTTNIFISVNWPLLTNTVLTTNLLVNTPLGTNTVFTTNLWIATPFNTNSSGSPITANPFTNWYQLSATFTRTNLTNAFITGKLQDMGPFGTNLAGTNMLVFNTLLCTNPIMPGMGTRLYAAFQAVENAGVELIDNFTAWVTPGAPQVTMPPLDQTVLAYRQVKLRVKVDGTPMFTYQWKKSTDGGTTWTDVPGATASAYTTPLLSSVGSTQYKVAVTNAFGGVESAAGTLTVLADSTPPAVVSVGSVDGLTVGVLFNEPLDPSSAATPGNYGVSSGAAVIGATLLPNGQTVKLTLGTAMTGAFTVRVNGVKDLAGNAATLTSPQGRVLGLTFVGDIGNPRTAGSSISTAPGALDQVGGGADISGTWDQGQMALAPRTGDFDIKVRVANISRGRNFNANMRSDQVGNNPVGDEITRAGLMARSSLYAGSTIMSAQALPPDCAMPGGANLLTAIARTGLYSAAVNPFTDLVQPPFGGMFPNLWLRLKRVNNTFTFYYATNQIPPDSYQGTFPYYNPTNAETTPWIVWGQSTQPGFSTNNLMYIGLATCAHWDYPDWASTVQFRNFGDFQGYPGISLAIVSNQINLTTMTATNIALPMYGYTELSFTNVVIATIANAPSNEVQFVWQKGNFAGGFTNLPAQTTAPTLYAGYGLPAGASNAISTLPINMYVGPMDNGTQYRAIVKAPGALSVTSAVFTVNVIVPSDTNQLAAWKAFIPNLASNIIDLTFNEPLDFFSTTNIANYLVRNGLGQVVPVTAVSLQQAATNGSPSRVILTTATLLPNNQNYTVTINNLRAANGTLIEGDSQLSWPYGGTIKVELFWNLTGTAGDVITNLTSHQKYLTNTPDLIFFTNSFSFGATAAGFGDNFNNYGGRVSGYFVPPSNGVYRFYIRSDDPGQLWINTNGPDPLARTLICNQRTFNANYGSILNSNMSTNITLKAGLPYYLEGLWKENSGGDGFAMTFRWFASEADAFAYADVPATNDIAAGTNFVPVLPTSFPLPNTTLAAASWLGPIRIELFTGLPTTASNMITLTTSAGFTNNTPNIVLFTNTFGWYWLASGANGAFPNQGYGDGYGARILAYFVAPSNGWYRFFIRADDTAELWMNTNSVNSADPAGKTRLAYRLTWLGQYTNDIAMSTNIYLTSNQWYYTEMLMRESYGGDGCSMAFRGFPTQAAGDAIPTYPISGLLSNVVASGNLFRPYPVMPRTVTPYRDAVNQPIQVEIYTNLPSIPGVGLISEMLSSPKYQAGIPDAIWYQSYFGWNRDRAATAYPGDYYGARVSAYFVAPSNATYKFFLRSDDQAYLYMNTDGITGYDPSGKDLIANNAGSTASWTGSGTYNLTNGVRYYMEMLLKEGAGGDGAGMTFTSVTNGGTPPNPLNGLSNDIAVARFFVPMTGAPKVNGISVNIGSVVVTNGTSVTLALTNYSGANPLAFQWKRNGQPIPDATGTTYITPILNPQDDLVVYTVGAYNPFGIDEQSIQLYVVNDVSPPALIKAVGNGVENEVTLYFNKPLDPVSSANPVNYAISDGVNTVPVLSAWLRPDNASVALLTGPQTIGVNYTVYVFNVKDANVNANPVLPFTKAQFTSWNYQRGLVTVDFFTGLNASTAIGSFTSELSYLANAPSDTRYSTFFGYTTYGVNYYGARAYAWFVAPSNGLYRFYIGSDDQSTLYMNTNTANGIDPNQKVAIAAVSTAPNGYYGDLTRGPCISPYITMNAGQWYYMEAIWKQGTSGDWCRVAFREKQVEDQGLNPINVGNTETIPGAFFVSLGNPDATKLLTVLRSPTNQTVNLGQIVQMSVSVTSAPIQTITYQWQKFDPASGDFKDIVYSTANPTPTTSILVDLPAAGGDYQYRALASVPGISVTSAVATVTVIYIPETTPTPPALVGVWANPSNLINVTAYFSEEVASNSATNTAHYFLTNMLGVAYGISNAVMLNSQTVFLTLSNKLVSGIQTNYALVATGVTDADDNLPSATSFPFYVADRFMTYEVFRGNSPPPSPFIPSSYPLLTNNIITNALWYSMSNSASPTYGYKPDGTNTYYYCLVKGYFIPPSNGLYRFYQASDDNSYLNMNVGPTDSASSAGKQRILYVLTNKGYTNVAAVTADYPMVAGQPYYLEVILGQGTGGEYVRTAFKEYNDYLNPAETTAMSAMFFSSVYTPPVPTPPSLVGAWGNPSNLVNVTAFFNESLTSASATNVTNYVLMDSASNSYAITNAVVATTNSVRLTLASTLTPGNDTNYTLTAANMVDSKFGFTNSNSCTFYVADRSLRVDVYTGLSAYNGVSPVVVPPAIPTYNGFISNYVHCGTSSNSLNCTIAALSANLDGYSARLYGYLIPPSNGVYRLYVAEDDQGELWLNTNNLDSASPAGAVMLVRNTANTGNYNNATCPWITMTAGQRYYFEARLHEGTGADYISAGIQEERGAAPTFSITTISNSAGRIPGIMMSSASFVDIPSMATMSFLDSLYDVVLTPSIGGAIWSCQWYLNDVPIPGATSPTLTLSGSVTNYHGNLYALVISNGFYTASNAAVLQVLQDVAPPALVKASADLTTLTTVTATFSECLDPVSAAKPANYVVAGSDGTNLLVQAAVLSGCKTVILTTEPRSTEVGVSYTLTASDIKDLAVNPNTLVSGTVPIAQLAFTPGFLAVDVWTNAGAATAAGMASWMTSAKFTNNDADFRTTIAGSEWHTANPLLPAVNTSTTISSDGTTNYGARIWGWFVPPVTATYQFYAHVDDSWMMYMNLSGPDPAGKILIASNFTCCQVYGGGTAGSWTANAALLTAGQPCYIEFLYKQGTGGEYAFFDYSINGLAPFSPPVVGFAATHPGAEVIGGSCFGLYGPPTLDDPPLITFTQQPQDTNVAAGTPVTFQVQADLEGGSTLLTNLFYQWQGSPDGVNWTNYTVPNKYQADFYMLGNMSNYTATFYYDTYVRCLATIPGGYSVSSAVVKVGVTDYNPDLGSGFFIASAGSLDGYTVRVVFNRPVDITYGTATDPGVYTFNGGMVGVLGTPVLQPDGRTVLLTVDTSPGGNNGPLVGPFSVETWGGPVYDYTGTMGAYQQFFSSSFAATYINNLGTNAGALGGDPFILGSAWSDQEGGVDMTAGGGDIHSTGDRGYYVARQVTGNFDVKVRVHTITNEFGKGMTDQWEKGALMARVSTNYNSRVVMIVSGPPYLPHNASTGNGQNLYNMAVRESDAAAIGYNVTANIAFQTNITPWLRLVRVGSVFYGYRSIDGYNWLLQGAKDTAGTLGGEFPDTLWLGLAATAHINSNNITVQSGLAKVKFRDLYMPMPATIVAQPSPAATVLDWNSPPVNMAFSVAVNNPPNSGNVYYQWRKNSVTIKGANTDTLTLNNTLPLAAAGSYDVIVANDGGGQVSTACVIIVTNAPPATSTEAFTTTQNLGALYPTSTILLPNDVDPEGAGLTAIRVSGIHPVTFSADFEAGIPPGVAIYGSTYWTSTNGLNDGACLHLTDAVANQQGSMIVSNLAPGRRIASFSASFQIRIADGGLNPADGFSFNFAPDLPDAGGLLYVNPPNMAPGTYGAEEGLGSGLSVNIDNNDNGDLEAPAIEVKFGGYVYARAPLYRIINTNYMDVKVDLWPDGKVDVYLTNNLILPKVQTPYVPTGGRFGFYGRTGGRVETHWLDNVSITAYTVESSVAGSVHYAADFNSGAFANAASFGSASVMTNGADVFMQLNPAANDQAGSFIINELTPGAPVASFMASFKVRIGDGSAEPADGLSFNFAPDLPNAAAGGTGNEEGVGTGLSVCFDNYRAINGTSGTAAFKVKYYGIQVAQLQVPVQNSSNWLPINVFLKPDGRLDLLVNGSYVFQNIATPYVPKTGRFGFYARTGGEFETHWLDDVNITAYTYGTAVLTNQAVVYTPPTNGCGNDSFYYVVSDPQGGMTLDMATVQVTPANPQPPAIVSCATNTTVFSLPGLCQGAIPDLSLYSGLVVTDNCCCVNFSQIPAAGTLLNPGVYTVIITATGGATGLSTNCSAQVTVLAKNPPLLSGCPADTAFGTDPGLCTAVVSWADPTAVDPCDGPVAATCVPPSGTTFPLGMTTVTCSATDSYGNEGRCSFTITVSDTTPPQLFCTNLTVGTSATTCDQVVIYSPTVTENCTVTNVACVPPSGSTFAVGMSNVTCTATDSSGNIGACTFTVTVNDTILPVFACPANMIMPVEVGTNGAVVAYVTPTGTDNCPGVGATMQIAGLPSGSFFPEGRTTNTFQATDAAGNVGLCGFVVYVGAGEFPVVTCPANIVGAADAGQGGKSNVTWTVGATATNCMITAIVCEPASGSTFAMGTNTVTCWATNDCGNYASCSFKVAISDLEKPVITCPANIEVVADAGQCGSAVTFAPTATDNCAVSSLTCVPASGGSFTVGSHAVTCIAMDVSGNTAQCSFTVKVDDTEKPAITCLGNNVVLGNTPGQCGKVVTYALPTATDNCTGTTVACLPASGSTFAVGVHTVTCTATDGAGNTAQCNFTVTINDSENPVITCPANIVAPAEAGQCGKVNVTFTATATDNCGVAGVMCVPASGSTFAVGATTVTCTATDSAGNTSQCGFTVKINDTEMPAITCPGNVVASADAGQCRKANVTWTTPTATDNCAVTNVACVPGSGSTFVVGTTTVTCTAKDAGGNIATCSFTVTINDTQKPVITSYPSFGIEAGADAGHCSKSNVLWLVSATDNCGIKSTVCLPPNGSTFAVGAQTVTCTVSDNANNTATCQFTVTVTETEKPVITTCAPTQTLTAGAGGTAALPDLTALTVVTDNCGTPALTQVPAAGTLLPVGSTNVVITATDASGNSATCSVAVVVQTGSKPVLAITQLDTGEVKVYWTAPATGWHLYSAPEILDTGTVWTEVSPSLYITNDGLMYILVTDPGSKPDKFYRLKNP